MTLDTADGPARPAGDRHGALVRGAKRWLRPLLLPIARAAVRYAPAAPLRQAVWHYVIRPFFIYVHRPFVVRTVFGAVIAGNTRDLIQRHLYYFGTWEPNLTGFLATRLREGDVFVDVGANIGYFTLLASPLVGPRGTVVAVEASPQIFTRLADNLARNRVTNVETFNLAIADGDGTTRLFLGADANLGQSGTVPRPGSRYECDVKTTSLDSLLAGIDAGRIRFVKVDVEGAEWPVLQGMRGLLRSGGPDLEVFVEVTPSSLQACGRSVDDLLALFAGCGFQPYAIANDYAAEAYLTAGAASRPRRLRRAITEQTDVVFSKVDAEVL